MSERIYLDNAATSWPKPETVYTAMDRYVRENGVSFGRGSSRHALDVARTIELARLNVSKLIDCAESNRIVFTCNGTDSLNLAIHGVLQPGDHVVTSLAEHNSVLRPLHSLEQNGVRVSRVPVDRFGYVSPDEIRAAILPATKMIVLIHASNVTGAIQPIHEVGRIAREHDLLFLLDAAQTLGHVATSVRSIDCDLLAAPGHKGLLGPTGTGILYVGPRAESKITSVRQGGTGTQSELDVQPETLPEKFESGNHNVPGLYGLAVGTKFLLDRSQFGEKECLLADKLFDGFNQMNHVRVFSPATKRLGVISIQIAGFEPQEVATILESSAAIQCRAGFHCAPRIHEAIGSSASGGTVRFSTGAFNSMDDIQTALKAIEGLVA